MAAKVNRSIVTLTVSPALDKSTRTRLFVPEQKIRCDNPYFEAGGGGINVAKAIKRLGGDPTAVFTSGGPTGRRLEALVREQGILTEVIETKEWTRENLNITEDSTGLQYRFSMPGRCLLPTELDTIIDVIEELEAGFLIASGSLAEGIPSDFYGTVAEITRKKGTKFILDTSGDPMKHALNKGLYLIKPNLIELAELVGVDHLELDDVDEAARALIIRESCEVVVVSMGAMGAMLVTADEIEHVPAPPVHKVSSVGAGDSSLAGIVWSLAQGKSLRDAARIGVACGSATVMNPGSEIFKESDVRRLLDWLNRYEHRYSRR